MFSIRPPILITSAPEHPQSIITEEAMDLLASKWPSEIKALFHNMLDPARAAETVEFRERS